MWSKYYQFGDVILQIDSYIEIEESERFAKFRVNAQKADYKVCVKEGEVPVCAEKVIQEDNEKCMWEENREKCLLRFLQTKNSRIPYSFTRANKESAIQIYTEEGKKYLGMRIVLEGFDFFELLNRKRAITLHSSYVRYGQNAILFSGPSGVGKSTQAKLWEDCRKAVVVNGDRTLIQKRDKTFFAHGICYAGTSKICENISTPLKAIVILKQATFNRLSLVKGRDSFKALISQCAFHRDNMEEFETLTATLAELLNEVPVYLLECTPDVRAIEILEEVLWKKEKQDKPNR